MKNFLCNIPLYVGLAILFAALGVKKVAEKCMELSFRSHVYFKTESGQRLIQYGEMVRKQASQLRAAQQDNQLAKILLGQNDKKSTDH